MKERPASGGRRWGRRRLRCATLCRAALRCGGACDSSRRPTSVGPRYPGHAVEIVEKHRMRSSAHHAASETRPTERAQDSSGDTEARNLRINSVWRRSDRSRGHRWAFPLVEWMVCRMRGKGVPGATARSSAIFESAVVASTSSSACASSTSQSRSGMEKQGIALSGGMSQDALRKGETAR